MMPCPLRTAFRAWAIIKKGTESDKIQICFRGILEEKIKILNLLKKEFFDSNEIAFETISNLETNIVFKNGNKINFIFKNFIQLDGLKKENSFKEYLNSLEKIYNKPFTLGNLKKDINGMDITIKPNGNVYFYGAEIYPMFNIYNEKVTINKLKKSIEDDKILKRLYSIPLKKLIHSLNKYGPFKDIINSIE